VSPLLCGSQGYAAGKSDPDALSLKSQSSPLGASQLSKFSGESLPGRSVPGAGAADLLGGGCAARHGDHSAQSRCVRAPSVVAR